MHANAKNEHLHKLFDKMVDFIVLGKHKKKATENSVEGQSLQVGILIFNESMNYFVFILSRNTFL